MRRTLNHDVDCVCNMIPKMSQSEVHPRNAFEKKDSCLPLSSMSNDSGVSSSLIRAPSYKNLQQTKVRTGQHTVTWKGVFKLKERKKRKVVRQKIKYEGGTLLAEGTHLMLPTSFPTLFAYAPWSLESFVVRLILKNTSSLLAATT